jgi:hypothetical protein
VVKAGHQPNGFWANIVSNDGANDIEIHFMHLAAKGLNTATGDPPVTVGQVIQTGYPLGNYRTDWGANSHVHVEVSVDGVILPPETVFVCGL